MVKTGTTNSGVVMSTVWRRKTRATYGNDVASIKQLARMNTNLALISNTYIEAEG